VAGAEQRHGEVFESHTHAVDEHLADRRQRRGASGIDHTDEFAHTDGHRSGRGPCDRSPRPRHPIGLGHHLLIDDGVAHLHSLRCDLVLRQPSKVMHRPGSAQRDVCLMFERGDHHTLHGDVHIEDRTLSERSVATVDHAGDDARQ
jgi:hypothetical protein